MTSAKGELTEAKTLDRVLIFISTFKSTSNGKKESDATEP